MQRKEGMSQLTGNTVAGPAEDCQLRGAALGMQLSEPESELYVRYVRALAVLCECSAYVDDTDYLDLIDELLADACRSYPLTTRQFGMRREIAPVYVLEDS